MWITWQGSAGDRPSIGTSREAPSSRASRFHVTFTAAAAERSSCSACGVFAPSAHCWAAGADLGRPVCSRGKGCAPGSTLQTRVRKNSCSSVRRAPALRDLHKIVHLHGLPGKNMTRKRHAGHLAQKNAGCCWMIGFSSAHCNNKWSTMDAYIVPAQICQSAAAPMICLPCSSRLS
jgi:hypothetical protein